MINPLIPKVVDFVDENNNATPETMLMAKHLDRSFLIDKIEPFYFSGLSSASSMSVYNPKIIYFILYFYVQSPAGAVGAPGSILLYNELNTLILNTGNNAFMWNTVTSLKEYIPNPILLFNVFFNRYVDNSYTRVLAIGLKINLK